MSQSAKESRSSLGLRQEQGDDFVDLFLAVAVAFDSHHELSGLVLGNDSVALELGLLEFLRAVSRPDFGGDDVELGPMCLFA